MMFSHYPPGISQSIPILSPYIPNKSINLGFCGSTGSSLGFPSPPQHRVWGGLPAKSLWLSVHSTGPSHSLQSEGHNPGKKMAQNHGKKKHLKG